MLHLLFECDSAAPRELLWLEGHRRVGWELGRGPRVWGFCCLLPWRTGIWVRWQLVEKGPLLTAGTSWGRGGLHASETLLSRPEGPDHAAPGPRPSGASRSLPLPLMAHGAPKE